MELLVHYETSEWVLLNNQRNKNVLFALGFSLTRSELCRRLPSFGSSVLVHCITLVVLVFEHTRSVSTSQSLSEHKPFHMTVFS